MAVGVLRLPRRLELTPLEVGLDLSASVNATDGLWQLAQAWPAGSDRLVSKNSSWPSRCFSVSLLLPDRTGTAASALGMFNAMASAIV